MNGKKARQLRRAMGPDASKADQRWAKREYRAFGRADPKPVRPAYSFREVTPNSAVRPATPTKVIETFFEELSDRGKDAAMRLRFGPPRTHGSPASLRKFPRGLPGTGIASRLSKPELDRRIANLKRYDRSRREMEAEQNPR